MAHYYKNLVGREISMTLFGVGKVKIPANAASVELEPRVANAINRMIYPSKALEEVIVTPNNPIVDAIEEPADVVEDVVEEPADVDADEDDVFDMSEDLELAPTITEDTVFANADEVFDALKRTSLEDLKLLTNKKLMEMCEVAGIKYHRSANKAELLDMLGKGDIGV